MSNYYYVMPDEMFYSEIVPKDASDYGWGAIDERNPSPLLGSFPLYFLKLDKKVKSVPDYFGCGALEVCSDRCKQLISSVTTAVEFLPVQVLMYGGIPAKGSPFWLIHSLVLPDCVDMEHSDVSMSPIIGCGDYIGDIRKLVFDETKLPNLHYFYPENLIRVFVSKELKDAIQREGLTGFDFVPLEELRY